MVAQKSCCVWEPDEVPHPTCQPFVSRWPRRLKSNWTSAVTSALVECGFRKPRRQLQAHVNCSRPQAWVAVPAQSILRSERPKLLKASSTSTRTSQKRSPNPAIPDRRPPQGCAAPLGAAKLKRHKSSKLGFWGFWVLGLGYIGFRV